MPEEGDNQSHESWRFDAAVWGEATRESTE